MKGEATSIHDFDKEKIIDGITELYQDNSDELGFVTRSELEGRFDENGVKFRHRDGQIVAALDYSHLERKPFTKVYRTAIDDAGSNKDRKIMLSEVLRESPWGVVRTKVPYDSTENDFWRDIGYQIDEESGKKRPLNIWQVRDEKVNTVLDY